ncbi:MAG: hypothetical protein ACXW4T_02410 [Candidatus Limnocylindrales bacterium]
MALIDFRPPQCTEQEPGGHEDCTWCAGVMLQNAAYAKAVAPSTRAEYEGLRVDGNEGPARNPEDGSSLDDLMIGMAKRYGWQPEKVGHVAWSTILRHLAEPGDGAVLQGWMGVSFDRAAHWRRWDPTFVTAHAVYVQRVDAEDRLWWMNPAAPNSFPGEFIPMPEAKRYYQGMRGGAMFVRVGQRSTEDEMPGLGTTPAQDLLVGIVRIPAGVEVINVETRDRVRIGADGATRQAVGPFVRDFGSVEGYFIRHRDPERLEPATYWVSAGSCTFSLTGT